MERPDETDDDGPDFETREEWLAAAEARALGGPPEPELGEDIDEALRPVYEAGGGEQEGFELAERDLIENASHGGGRGDPLHDRPSPEIESDESTAVYGEPDEEKISEVVRDPTSKDPDDPGIGPGVTHER
jgi:hypothetical protein